jgi:hypothetical protein
MFNVSVLVTTTDEDHRIIEKYLIVYIKDKRDFNLTLSNNKVEKEKLKFLFENFDSLDNGKFASKYISWKFHTRRWNWRL